MTDFDKPREACGIFGICDHAEAASITYFGLYALQHRGQESAGIATIKSAIAGSASSTSGSGSASWVGAPSGTGVEVGWGVEVGRGVGVGGGGGGVLVGRIWMTVGVGDGVEAGWAATCSPLSVEPAGWATVVASPICSTRSPHANSAKEPAAISAPNTRARCRGSDMLSSWICCFRGEKRV